MYNVMYTHFFTAAVGPGNRVSTAASPPQTASDPSDPASSGSDNTVAIIGGMVAAIVITIVIAITVLIAIAILVRGRRAEFSPSQKYTNVMIVSRLHMTFN